MILTGMHDSMADLDLKDPYDSVDPGPEKEFFRKRYVQKVCHWW